MKALTVIAAVGAAMPLACGVAVASTPNHSVPKRCTLVVDNKVLVNGRCFVYPLDFGGYTLNTWDHGKPRQLHFAQVNAEAGGKGEATWNADPHDDHAQDPLGTVRLANGCWVNERVRMCAR